MQRTGRQAFQAHHQVEVAIRQSGANVDPGGVGSVQSCVRLAMPTYHDPYRDLGSSWRISAFGTVSLARAAVFTAVSPWCSNPRYCSPAARPWHQQRVCFPHRWLEIPRVWTSSKNVAAACLSDEGCILHQLGGSGRRVVSHHTVQAFN